MASNYDLDDHRQQRPPSATTSSSDLVYNPSFVPDSMKSFIVHLYRHIRGKNVYEIHQMYETSFHTLSDRLFKNTTWPSVDAIAPYVDNGHVFCLLYREIWFRHLFARLQPTLKQRIDSWDSYCSLFQVVLLGVVNVQLPNQSLWDIIDEFVYQFQSFCQYMAKMKTRTEQEVSLLRQFDQAWNVYGVLNAWNVHCLLGDYHTGLKCLLSIDISQQVKLVEETVNAQLREKYGEKMTRMQRYDDEAFSLYDELFSYVCLKFIMPSAPNYDEPLVNYNHDAYRLQLKFFLYEVQQEQSLNGVQTFLKVYSSISIAKFASYMEMDEATLRTILLTYKHKTHTVDIHGKITSNADVDFYIDGDVVHVIETKPSKRYGDYFLHQILKLEGVTNDLDRIKLD